MAAIGVEPIGGLVEQQRLGLTEQCAGEGEALVALAKTLYRRFVPEPAPA